MTRKFKALGVALVAVFAMSALAASAANAEETPEYFHGDAEHIVLTGTGSESTLELEGGVKVSCAGSSYEGTVLGTEHEGGSYTVSSVTVHPEYYGAKGPGSNCDALGGTENATVNTDNCHYNLGATTDGNGVAGAAVVGCESPITISIAGCQIYINNQEGLTGVTYTNNGTETNEKDVTVSASVGGITYTSNGAFACIIGGVPKSGNNAAYSESVTTKGYEYVSGSTGSYVDGEQVGIWHGPTS